MPVAGLNPSLRYTPGYGVADEAAPVDPAMPMEGVMVDIGEGDAPQMDDAGNILRIEHDDGSITVSLDGRPVGESEAEKAREWFSNLVDDIDQMELSRIAEDLLRGISDDMESRRDWVETRAEGIKLLGLKIELPALQGAADGAPVDGMSRVRHPLLLEAVLRFQANARSELLPTDGPVKVRNDSTETPIEDDLLAMDLETDLNHYLTVRDKEYYPDTDKMLFLLGFGGTTFKKVYFCPLRGRPVSETVDADDLIVSNSATTLSDAKRVTHRVYLRPSTVKRLQILGVYRDLDLTTPSPATPDSVQQEKADQQGITLDAANPDDRDREIYECYCELDIRGFEHKHKGRITGLEIPYRVTIDVSSREILSIVRNYDEPTGEPGDELPEARTTFVKYTFVPGLGFYDIGLLHILGNTTNAVTAAWREMLDAGMFANFPGFLMADTGARQNTNIFRVPPGGGALVKTNGLPVRDAIMPLPYKEPGPAMSALVQSMVETGQRVGGTAELPVGEGRQDAPVGTTLALIDQATKVLNSVHKRLHASQAEEFQLLVRCFREHPESFWGKNKKAQARWNEQTFLQALENYDLIPQADPNTASKMQRLMKVMGLKQLASANPQMYDMKAVDLAAMESMGWSNPERFLATQPPTPSLESQNDAAEIEIKQQDAQTKRMIAEAKIAEVQRGTLGGNPPDPVRVAELHVQNKEIGQKQQESLLDAESRRLERESRERLAAVKLAETIAQNPMGLPIVERMLTPQLMTELQSNETQNLPGVGN